MDASVVHRVQVALQLLKRNLESDMIRKMDSHITGPQMFMLYFINKHERCKLNMLADKMEVKPSAITVMIDRLEKPGYVKRTHDQVDRRSVLVEITPEGKEILVAAVKQRNEILSGYLSRLEPNETVLVAELLEKMVDLKPDAE
jgi:MarR family transcriptional regulator, organic hydroperoxide resistance regulator